jgi:hypothetical protein
MPIIADPSRVSSRHRCCAPVGCCRHIPMAAVAASPRAPTAGRPSLRRTAQPLALSPPGAPPTVRPVLQDGLPHQWSALHLASRGATPRSGGTPTCSPGRPPAAMVGLAAGITRRDSEERRHLLMLVSRGPGRRRGNVQWVHFRPPRQRFVRYISVRARSTGRRTYSLISIARPPH